MAQIDLAQFYGKALRTARRHRLASATREQAAHAALEEAQRVMTLRAFVTVVHALGGREALVARLAGDLAEEEEKDACGSPSPK
jgi:hypothetical protein